MIEQNPIWCLNQLNRVFNANQDRSDTSKPKTPESDCIRLKNTMKQIQQLENTIGDYDKLLSDPELGKRSGQYKKESMERMELVVIKLRTLPPCIKPCARSLSSH
ncbi:hypothetical protein TNIN_128051 [Trichonephila inaurata madagascariensis]|uniref:Uncharacterized protein n=1 Tax=Trichonephila inaurata madagascariensis TaxID=2747483 RepID=A0A8X6YMK5_9ARAC|nr:hypothetical protein TNIN_128051 [Trichonephila inaurata madagascariensis]